MHILIIEDDAETARVVRRALQEDGYAVDVADTVADGRTRAFARAYDGIILDMQLTDGHGLSLLRELREAGRRTPVLVFSGEDDTSDVVRGLDLGADEYVRKPTTARELVARLRAVLRRTAAPPEPAIVARLAVGDVVLDRLTHEVHVGARRLDLTPKEFRLLEALLVASDAVVSRETLLLRVWQMDFDPGSNVVDVHVARLRRKLDGAAARAAIVAVRGEGFRLLARD